MPWLAFSILAMVLAVIVAVGVAAPHAPRDGIRRVILRWFHALTWSSWPRASSALPLTCDQGSIRPRSH
jgi:hypothetical protein